MADYSTIKGFSVETLASDPYATAVSAGTWSSGATLGTAVYNKGGGAGTLTAGLAISGKNTPGPTANIFATTQKYDGTTWTAGNDVNEGRSAANGCGTATAALFTGGNANQTPEPWEGSEEYDGTSWTTGNNLGEARGSLSGAGIQTAAFVAGGRNDPGGFPALMETYDGTSWTEVGNLNTARALAGAGGTTTAGVIFGGITGDPSLTGGTAITEEWDGTSWTNLNNMNQNRRELGSCGPQTAAFGFGGIGPPSNAKHAVAESYDGTSWTEQADLATARYSGAPSHNGSQTAAFYAGGNTGSAPTYNITEEFSVPSTTSVAQEGQVWYNSTSNVLKGFGAQGTGAWASGSNVNTARNEMGGGAGTQTAFLIFGGQPGAPVDQLTESYDGSTWTETGDLNTSRYYASGFGSQTAAVCATGNPGTTVNVESFNGTSWSEENNVNTGRWGPGSSKSAPSTAAIIAAGKTTVDVGIAEEWNGTSWTETSDLTTARRQVASLGGSSTAAMIMSGNPAPKVVVEEWDGSAWTEVADLGSTRYAGGGSGTTGLGLSIGGGPAVSLVEQWNGSTWTEVADLSTAHLTGASGGSGAVAIIAVGRSPAGANLNVTEEWNIPDATKTFTAS